MTLVFLCRCCVRLQVVAYVQRRLNLRHSLGSIAEGLVAEAMQPQRCAHDNVTVVVVQLNEQSDPLPGAVPAAPGGATAAPPAGVDAAGEDENGGAGAGGGNGNGDGAA